MQYPPLLAKKFKNVSYHFCNRDLDFYELSFMRMGARFFNCLYHTPQSSTLEAKSPSQKKKKEKSDPDWSMGTSIYSL